ncbi:putative deacetylase LmbE-like domain-containing protein [Catenaria anguillulae PL171]|uniref:N-acetylglucosaminylphosphatidylinositol deacetylase n=1 Tax=Catenaria anguillulae PL171 TaxID=765915 RepID=A0A1Y2HL05_9FUNG|nr:putative deacetylase LmbE-like domain-containing protein [Catenaria anguillulae PL171]
MDRTWLWHRHPKQSLPSTTTTVMDVPGHFESVARTAVAALSDLADLVTDNLDQLNLTSTYTTAAIFVFTLLISRYLLFRPLSSPAVPAFHGPTRAQAGGPVLLVIAHPDDECMFFAPTLLALHAQSVPVHILCLSTGNADGLGAQRVQELVRSAKVLHIPSDRVHYVDSPDLQDGMRTEWPAREVIRHVRDTVNQLGVSNIITFDDAGVSGHANHIAISRALQIDPDLAPITWHLHSVPRLAKYAMLFVRADTLRDATAPDPMKWWLLGETGARLGRGEHLDVWRVVARPAQVQRAQLAMQQHASQLVWYRKAFMRVARYFVVNELVKMSSSRSSRGAARVVTAGNVNVGGSRGARLDQGNRTV